MTEKSAFRIIRSARRKHIALRAGKDGILEILSPAAVPDSYLQTIICRETALIKKVLTRARQQLEPEFIENAEFWLLGKKYPLHLTRRLRIFDHAFMIPDGSDDDKKAALITLYKELARQFILPRTVEYQSVCGTIPRQININSATTRWGSCSSKKTLSFSWKLIQCPCELIDYVIVHELTHLLEMNHSPAFWAKIHAVMPDCDQRRQKLKEFARQLPVW